MDERILKYFNDDLSQQERLSLLREVEVNEALKLQFVSYQNIYALMNLSPQIRNKELSEKHFKTFIHRRQKKTKRNKYLLWTKYAAAIAILVAVSTIMTHQFLLNNQLEALVNTGVNTLYTPTGQRSHLILQDGTEVWLNAKSSLTYPACFTGNERQVKLEGEAFFQVAKDSSKPFIVSVQDVNIKVLGTQFNVYGYAEAGFIQTSLLEGSVCIYYQNKEKDGVVLRPNQQVTVKHGNMQVEPILLTDHFLWREGIYTFNEEPLINILKKMEIYYDVKIIVKDSSIFKEKYTGKFRQRDSLDDIFKILQQICPFKIKKDIENNSYTLSK